MDDSALIASAASGDELAFELLVRRHTDSVWRVARSLLHDNAAAEEAVQDTFLKAYRALGRFRPGAPVRTWLLVICHRTCIDQLRTRRAGVVSLDELRQVRSRQVSPDFQMAFRSAMEALPARQRQAFALVAVLGYNRDEAAEIANVPASTMRSRMQRARALLAEALSDAPAIEEHRG